MLSPSVGGGQGSDVTPQDAPYNQPSHYASGDSPVICPRTTTTAVETWAVLWECATRLRPLSASLTLAEIVLHVTELQYKLIMEPPKSSRKGKI